MISFPNAKINLGLNILSKRADGFHDISTVMVGVDWCDILEIVPAQGESDKLVCSGIKVDCPSEKNLVMKAVRGMRELPGVLIPPVEIHLHKNIPDGAGLGGGSADAAFTITTLNKLFSLNLSKKEMAGVAARIGSDCSFFIYDSPMLATGRGEILVPINGLVNKLKDKVIVIVRDHGEAVSTAVAYAGVNPRYPDIMPDRVIEQPMDEWKPRLINDFEESVYEKIPLLQCFKDRMYECGAIYSAMSGSGSSIFGIFEKEIANQIDFAGLFPNCYIHVGSFIL